MYSESYFEKALVPKEVRTFSDINIYLHIRYCEKEMNKLFVMWLPEIWWRRNV